MAVFMNKRGIVQSGLSDEDLALATATPEDVFSGKTFYAGNRELKMGTAEKGAKITIYNQSIEGVKIFNVGANFYFALSASAFPDGEYVYYYAKVVNQKITNSSNGLYNYVSINVYSTESGCSIEIDAKSNRLVLSFPVLIIEE